MKNLKKVLAVMTAVASLCMSATAFAATGTVSEDGGLSGSFDWDTSTLSIVNGATPKANSETTILVLDKDANDTNVAEGDILYINQKNTSEGKDFSNMGLKLTDVQNLADGEYIVKVGYYPVEGEFTIATAKLTVSSGTTPSGVVKTITWGDLNFDNSVDGQDGLYAMLAYLQKYTETTVETETLKIGDKDNSVFKVVGAEEGSNTVVWGDLNADNSVDGQDGLYAMLGYLSKYTSATVCGKNVKIGETKAEIDLTNKTITFKD